jgi:hypothetical protein
MARHMAAIACGAVTKTNVIGLRKACNHVWRLRQGLPGNRCAAKPHEVDGALRVLAAHPPIVRGELHDSGIKLLTDRRYKKRLESVAGRVDKMTRFCLVGFHDIERGHYVPVYRAYGYGWSFDFYNVPWQAAMAYGIEGGPHIVRGVGS